MINTGGFQVQNLARYTPVNPELMALNPQSFASPFMSALDISKAINQQKEEAATKALRINATNAKNQTIASVAPSDAEAQIANNGVMTATAAGRTGEMNARNALLQRSSQAALGAVDAKAAAEKAAAEAALGESDITKATQAPRLANAGTLAEAEGSSALKALKAKDVDYNQKIDLASKSEEAAKATLDETIQNLAADKATHRDLVKAQADYYRAHGEAQRAIADYNEYQRGSGKPYQDFQMIGTQISQETNNLSRLYSTKVAKDDNGKDMTLGEYLDQYESYPRNAKGEAVKDAHRFNPFTDAEIAKLPANVSALIGEANNSKNNINNLRKLQSQLQFTPQAQRNAAGAKTAAPTAPAGAPQTASFSTPQEAQAAVEAGQFQDGDTIMIGGKPKIVRIKR